jgi:hypothetical protein
MTSLYLYGIARAAVPLEFTATGVAGGIRPIRRGEIVAIAGAAPAGCDFQALRREQAMRFLLQHQQVLEDAIAQSAVLPVKFGTLAPDEDAVRQVLAVGGSRFCSQLAELNGRLQMDIAVRWPLEQIFREIADAPRIAEMRRRALASGEVTAKAEVGEAVKAELDSRRAALAGQICSALHAVSHATTVNPAVDDHTVTSVSLLVDRDKRRLLDNTLEALDASTGGQLTFRCVGPLAPAAFATVEVDFPSRESVDWARRKLELGPKVRPDAIRSSYHRLARTCHPDAVQDGAQAAQMDEIAKAYRLLMLGAKTLAPGGEDDELSLDGSGPAWVTIRIAGQDARGAPVGAAIRDLDA